MKEVGSISCSVCWQLRKTQATGPSPKVGEWGEVSGRVSPVGSLLTQKQNPLLQDFVAPSGEILILSLFLGRVPAAGAGGGERRCAWVRGRRGEGTPVTL